MFLTWVLFPSTGYANALFVDDFETGGTGAWEEEPVPEEAIAAKFISGGASGVPGRYTVTLFAIPAASAAAELVSSVGGTLGYIYPSLINGFEAELSEAQAISLSQDSRVRQVIQDAVVAEASTSGTEIIHCYEQGAPEYNGDHSPPPLPAPVETQTIACSNHWPGGDCIDNWGLDRVDQQLPPIDGDYTYRQAAGAVTVFVVDKGVAAGNQEFDDGATSNSRVLPGINTTCNGYPTCTDPSETFGNSACYNDQDNTSSGHGTHVAGILGGRTYGLAKDVVIHPVKALCAPTLQSYIQRAFVYVDQTHHTNSPTAIVNLSGVNTRCLADPTATSCYSLYNNIRTAMVNLAKRNNVLIIQSAGNQSFTSPDNVGVLANACNYALGDESDFPILNDEREAVSRIVVAGGTKLVDPDTIDEHDGLLRLENGENGYPFASNVGSCVDIFAPASNIVSAYYPDFNPDPDTQDYAICQLSGTSMAAPHVSGVAAMILNNYPSMPSRVLKWAILNWGTPGILEANSGDPYYIGAGSPNRLLYWSENAIFADRFESGDFRMWDDVEP